MSLVQSFINQIGREIGRDVYRSIKNNKSVTTNYGSGASTTWDQLQNFKLSAYDKLTMNNLVNLVQAVSELSPNNFDNSESFVILDEKIDFCKEYLSDKYLEQLEKLDNLNRNNFKDFILRHKIYIANLHDSIEQKITNYKEPDKLGIGIFNPWNIILLIGFIILSINYRNLVDWKPTSFWIGLSLLGLLGWISVNSTKEIVEGMKKNHQKNIDDLKVLEDYFEKLTKVTID